MKNTTVKANSNPENTTNTPKKHTCKTSTSRTSRKKSSQSSSNQNDNQVETTKTESSEIEPEVNQNDNQVHHKIVPQELENNYIDSHQNPLTLLHKLIFSIVDHHR